MARSNRFSPIEHAFDDEIAGATFLVKTLILTFSQREKEFPGRKVFLLAVFGGHRRDVAQ